MTKRLQIVGLALLGIALTSATPDQEAEELVRQGNRAFAEGRYEEAASLYQQAEERTTDPGLVAFNKAASLYAKDRYEAAESYYWLCLGDAGPRIEKLLRQHPDRDLPAKVRAAAGPRLARVLYNVGNCFLKKSDGTRGEVLEQAIIVFDHCQRLNDGDARFRADVRHNWELAKELSRLHPKPPRRDKPNSDQEGTQPSQPKESPGGKPEEQGSDPDRAKSGSQLDPDAKVDSGANAQLTEEATAGKGNLAALPDADQLHGMTRAEAAAYLREAVQRILGERRIYHEQASKYSSHHVQDW
jgi:tetratricopeptide (TPR) repeat protein